MILKFLIIFQLTWINCQISKSKTSKFLINENIIFVWPDLTIDYFDKTSLKEIQLNAFKSFANDLILNENKKEKYSQLKWFSIGYPKILINKQDNNKKVNICYIETHES